MASAAHRLGLTGGIGSGKSTVAHMLARMGAYVIDADAISRAVTARNGAAIEALEARFGASVLTEDGALNRDAMRALIFSDPGAKLQLETIVHPLVTTSINAQTEQAKASATPCIIFDIPLLVESSHWRPALERVLVVDCTEATQVTRVMARNGLSATDIQKIISAQAPRVMRLKAADWVVFNDAISLEELEHHVRRIGIQFGL